MKCYDVVFKEYSGKWNVDIKTVETIFMILDYGKHYSMFGKSLQNLGFKISPRQLKYFYRKVILTQRYGLPSRIGNSNYKRLVLDKS